MPILSTKRPSSSHHTSRQENRYQNRLSKEYIQKQKLLKELQTHPEIIATSHTPPRTLTSWQQILLLSSLFSIQPAYARNLTPSHPVGQDPLQLSTPHTQASNLTVHHSSYTSLPSVTAPHTQVTRCHTTLACFSNFLRDAGSNIQHQFAHLLNNQANPSSFHRQNLKEIHAHLLKTFPQLNLEDIDTAHSIKRTHHRRHLESTNVNTDKSYLHDSITQLDQHLERWANITQSKKVIHTPSHALGAVLHHYDVYLPDNFFLNFNSNLLDKQSMKLIDEAARLYSYAPENPLNITHATSIETLRKNFLEILTHDLKKEMLLADMLQPSYHNNNNRLFFDGIAIQGAFGKTIDTILNTPELASELTQIPQFKELSIADQHIRLKEKFDHLGENTQYVIGTTAQSLATTIHRLLGYQHQTQVIQFTDEKTLFEYFHQLETQWESQRNYPIHPRLLFAEHLAHASGLKIRNTDWQEKFWAEYIHPYLRNLINHVEKINPAQANKSALWLATYLSYWNDEGQTWSLRGIDIQREAFASLYAHLKEIAHRYYTGLSAKEFKSYLEVQGYTSQNTVGQYKTYLEKLNDLIKINMEAPKNPEEYNLLQANQRQVLHSINTINEYFRLEEAALAQQTIHKLLKDIEYGNASALPSGDPPEVVILFAKQITESLLAKEFILGDDWHTRTAALIRYATERLLANYGTAPVFDRKHAAYEILIKHNIPNTEISDTIWYTLATENMHLQKTLRGSRIEEFLQRADWSSSRGHTMYIRDDNDQLQRINTRIELQAAEEDWNAQLPQHPWVQARARENCRLAQTLWINNAATEEVKKLSKNYLAETEEHRQLMRGFELWINTIPIVGPVYNIEEGIRHHDKQQIIAGSIFLGIDAFDLLISGRSRHPPLEENLAKTNLRVPPMEHITATSLDTIAEDIDISLTELTSNAPVNSESYINTNPWEIELDNANIPPEYRTLATRVRDGEVGVKWTAPNDQQFSVIKITNENRITPVRKVGSTYREVSWEDGHIVRNARLIYHDPLTDIYTSGGLKGGGKPSGDTLIENQPLRKRQAVLDIKALLKKAKTTDTLSTDPYIFIKFFTIQAIGINTTFDIHHFYSKLYKKSVTFRRLANHFFYNNKEHWLIIIENIARPYIRMDVSSIEFKSIHIPTDQKISQLQYRGIDSWHAFLAEQIYLDGLLPALTGKDSLSPPSSNTRVANIILRDRILFEAGYELPQQISFSTATTEELSADNYHSLDSNPESSIVSASEILNLENRYLDPLFNERITFDTNTELLGTPINDRFTVREVKLLEQNINIEVTDFSVEKALFSMI